MPKQPDQGQEGVRQHARMAMGKDIGHPAAKSVKGFKSGGQVPKDTTTYQRYGNGFRKSQGK